MTCTECRDELLLSFGQRRLPEDAESHLSGCAECRRYYAELSGAAEKLDNDPLFFPDRGEIARLAARIERAIDDKGPAKVTSLGWLRYVAAAASIVLLAGIALIDHRHGTSSGAGGGSTETIDSSALPGYAVTSAYDAGNSVQSEELGDADVRALLRDYTSSGVYDADAKLLNDLTEAEMQYLKENLKAKDLM